VTDADGRTTGTLLVLAAAAAFGTLGVLGKVAFATGWNVPSMLAGRFFLGSVVVWAFLLARRRRRPPEERASLRLRGRSLAAAVALGAGCYAGMSGLFFASLSVLTAGVATVVLYVAPVLVVLESAAFLGVRPGRRALVAVPLSVGGVALIAGADPAGVDPAGVALVFGAAALYATYITAGRAVLESVDGPLLAGYVTPAAGAGAAAYGVAVGPFPVPTAPRALAVVLVLATVGTAFPVVAHFLGLRLVGANRAGVLATFEPVVAVALGAVALGEPVTAVTVVGGAMVAGGVLLVRG
jgi:drug/metabolite transporter (DMT)-like permease